MDAMLKMSERELIDAVENRLVEKFAKLPASRVSAAVDQAHAHFAQSPIRDFIPLLVERRVTSELAVHADAPVARDLVSV